MRTFFCIEHLTQQLPTKKRNNTTWDDAVWPYVACPGKENHNFMVLKEPNGVPMMLPNVRVELKDSHLLSFLANGSFFS
jgi:hypothetical protein